LVGVGLSIISVQVEELKVFWLDDGTKPVSERSEAWDIARAVRDHARVLRVLDRIRACATSQMHVEHLCCSRCDPSDSYWH
jgi:hypothetical protein